MIKYKSIPELLLLFISVCIVDANRDGNQHHGVVAKFSYKGIHFNYVLS